MPTLGALGGEVKKKFAKVNLSCGEGLGRVPVHAWRLRREVRSWGERVTLGVRECGERAWRWRAQSVPGAGPVRLAPPPHLTHKERTRRFPAALVQHLDIARVLCGRYPNTYIA